MRRRTLIATIGAALPAGCLGTADTTDGSPSTTNTGSSATEVPSNDGFSVTAFDVSTTKVAPEKQYFVRIDKVYSTDAVSREEGEQTILDVDDIESSEHRNVVKMSLSEGKVWRDSVPDRLRELTERVDFFTWESDTDPDATATHWGVAVYRAFPDREPVLEFGAELVDDHVAPDDPGAIVFSLTNVGDDVQSVFSGAAPPFSILWAERTDTDAQALLWRDYVEEDCVSVRETDGDTSLVWCDIGITTDIEPGETVERRYEIRSQFDRDALAEPAFDSPGEYSLDETLEYHRSGEVQGPWTNVDWRVEFTLESD
ncbi:hypothetical protein [Haloarchaeobius sp. DFWS5]|uniref:hypothetical protein n=1 Tax=Haloarchaeobius sp. DFWS5 TaxID=3446114 RepID=UPI003EBF1B6A